MSRHATALILILCGMGRGTTGSLTFEESGTLGFRPYIAWSLRAGGILLLVLIVSSLLWFFLGSMGDHKGAGGFRAVTLVALVCWGLDFVTLVVLLALSELASAVSSTDDREEA